MSIEIQPYFAEGERYPALIGVRAEGDEYETAYVSKSELVDALAENDKLRGLLEAVLQCAGETKRDKGCDACPMYNGPWRNDGTWCLLRPTLRELGVEVD